MDPARRAAVFLALALPLGAAIGVSSVTTLALPGGGTVAVELGQALTLRVRKPSDGVLLFDLGYPGGAGAAADQGSIRVIVKGAGARTRPEAVVAQAAAAPPATAPVGIWLERSQGGVSVYRIRTPANEQELRVFHGADGALVGSRQAPSGSTLSVAERRYLGVLEVIYQPSRELDASPQELDRFVTDYLAANLDILRSGK